MSYLVLARKYRPSKFSEVIGQDHVTRTLGNAFASGRVHHAFLFCGPRGCGKTTLARIVGKALNCQARSGAEPCGECSACTSISNGSAVDYLEMDGASNRGIDAIRELTEAVRYQPAVLKKKVYVIDEVHMLTTEAFNALLKTLEEPPPHVTFVLATTEPHKLPNTILSRCQRFDFKLVPASRLAHHLTSIFHQEKLAIEPAAIGMIVRESGGSVRDALSLCDQLISFVGDVAITETSVAEILGVADRSLTRRLVGALAAGDPGTALAAVESAIERGVDEIQLARAVVRYLRDISVLQVAPQRPELVDASDEELRELGIEAGGISPARVTQMFDRMLRCCDELGKTLQPRLVLDCALIDVATVEPLVPLGDLFERLGALEARIASKGGASAISGPGPSRGGGGGASRPAPPSGAVARSVSPADSARSGTAQSVPSPPSTGSARPASPPVLPAAATSSAGEIAVPSASAPESPVVAEPRSGPVESRDSAARLPSDHSAPVSMQPSGPVPTATAVASGSGPHDPGSPGSGPTGGVPVPPFAVPRSSADALRAWNDVLAQLEARRRFSLLGPFQHARILSWTEDQIEFGFPVDVHSMGEMASDKQALDELRGILRELAPELKSVKLAVKLLDERESSATDTRSVLETTRDRSHAERIKRESEAREHPITKHVLHTFGAQIKEIKTDV